MPAPNSAKPVWIDLADPETVERVLAAIQADPQFLAEALEDLNGAVERRMGISFPIPLHLEMDGGVGKVWPKDWAAYQANAYSELTDADLDLVTGGDGNQVSGGSMRVCEGPGGCDNNGNGNNNNSSSNK